MNIDQIVAKMFSGKATQEELQALNVWKAEAEENIKAIKEMQSIDKNIQETVEYKDYDVESAWAEMEQAMAAPVSADSPAQGKIVKMPWLRQAVAACALVLVGIVGWQMYSSSTVDDTPTKYLTAEDAVKNYTLEDGSLVTVDLKSTVETLDNRSVRLDGRAHFNVAKSEGDQFTIATEAGKITVLGTKFTVDTRPETFTIFVTEGKVRYDYKSHKIELTAGDKLTIYKGDPLVVKGNNAEVNGWMSTKLSFKNDLLSTVVPLLMKKYNREIVIDNPKKVAKCRVNTTFNKESFTDVLNELSTTLGLKYHNIDGVIHIVDGSC